MIRENSREEHLYDGLIVNNKYVEVFINPTSYEIKQVKKSDEYNSLRGLIYNDGTIFIWPSAVLHFEINKYLKQKIDTTQLNFSIDNNYCVLNDVSKKTKFRDLMNVIIDNRYLFHEKLKYELMGICDSHEYSIQKMEYYSLNNLINKL